ncbi:hypothetical protein [Lacimicrobium sp. SS2-24]|uniref:hypothetical protein n=1 Tax=Lacimicrobium sp. SS2-24 TaxID=2005569 RepID=UPI000B4C0251|nr:hypothetical protein [Lacimicrobium sp. SS2-24]
MKWMFVVACMLTGLWFLTQQQPSPDADTPTERPSDQGGTIPTANTDNPFALISADQEKPQVPAQNTLNNDLSQAMMTKHQPMSSNETSLTHASEPGADDEADAPTFDLEDEASSEREQIDLKAALEYWPEPIINWLKQLPEGVPDNLAREVHKLFSSEHPRLGELEARIQAYFAPFAASYDIESYSVLCRDTRCMLTFLQRNDAPRWDLAEAIERSQYKEHEFGLTPHLGSVGSNPEDRGYLLFNWFYDINRLD